MASTTTIYTGAIVEHGDRIFYIQADTKEIFINPDDSTGIFHIYINNSSTTDATKLLVDDDFETFSEAYTYLTNFINTQLK